MSCFSSAANKENESLRSKRFDNLSKVLNEDQILSRLPTRLIDVDFSEDEDDELSAISSSNESKEKTFSEVRALFPEVDEDLKLFDSDSFDFSHRKSPVSKGKGRKVSTSGALFQRSKPQSLDFEVVYKTTLKKISEMGAAKKSSAVSQPFDSPSSSFDVMKYKDKKPKERKQDDKSLPSVIVPKASISANDELLIVKGRAYKVLSFLGKGGSCQVHAAYDNENKTVVAIKCVDLSQTDVTVREGYAQEIQYLKALQDSDYVIKMHDYEFCGNKLFVVLEKGDTDFAHYLSNEKTKRDLDSLMIKFYWSQMLKAVAEIHKIGIIHSDLKPANFLLVAGHLKLIDFGIAVFVPTDHTSVLRDTQVGTLNYMSPETINSYSNPDEEYYKMESRHFKLSVKADVWSLGCILYYMIYGRTPFEHIINFVKKMTAIIDPNYELAYPVDCKDPSVIPVLKLCLERDVKKRASVEELLRHPYLTNKAEGNVEDEHKKLLLNMQNLTPRRFNAISGIIEKLSKQEK